MIGAMEGIQVAMFLCIVRAEQEVLVLLFTIGFPVSGTKKFTPALRIRTLRQRRLFCPTHARHKKLMRPSLRESDADVAQRQT